jgi:hypothetical protein
MSELGLGLLIPNFTINYVNMTSKESGQYNKWRADIGKFWIHTPRKNSFTSGDMYSWCNWDKSHPAIRMSNYSEADRKNHRIVSSGGCDTYSYIKNFYIRNFINAVQASYNDSRDAYPQDILKSETQAWINEMTGTVKIEFQNSLNNIWSNWVSINNVVKGWVIYGQQSRRDDGSLLYNKTFVHDYDSGQYTTFVSKMASLKPLIQKELNVLQDLHKIKNNAQNTVLQQRAEREAQRREAEGLAEHCSALIADITGEPKITYSNELTRLVQIDYVPQIEGLKILKSSAEQTLAAQIAQAAQEKLEALIEVSSVLLNDIGYLIASITDTTTKTDLQNRLTTLQAMEESEERNVGLEALKVDTLVASKKQSFEARIKDTNVLIGKLPRELGEPLYEELKHIVDTTENTVSSLTNGLERLNNMIPQVEAQLADLVAENIDEYISSTDAQRAIELNAIAKINEDEKILEIITLKQEVNSLLAQVPSPLNTVFDESIDEAESYEVVKQLAFYQALVLKLKHLIANIEYYSQASIQDIIGLKYELNTGLHNDADMLETEILANESSQAVQETTPKGAGGAALPLLLGGAYLLFNFL